MIKFDENKNITEEYKNYVSNLEREELEIMHIGADAYVDRLNNVLNELENFILNHYIVGDRVQNYSLDCILKKLKELKENDK